MVNIEGLMEEIGRHDASIIFKVDHERMKEGGNPWTMVISGPGLGRKEIVRTDAPTLNDCLNHALSELRTCPGDWEWVKRFIG